MDSSSGGPLRSPTYATSSLSPGFEPSRERARSPPSPRPPSPISRSSPATPTGTRGRDDDGAEEDGWKAFGPNVRIAELKSEHQAGGRQGFQKLPSPLGIYARPDDGQQLPGVAMDRMYDGTEDEAEEREFHHRRRKSESAIQGEGRRVGAGGLPSPSVSPPGSPRPSTAGVGLRGQSQNQSQPGASSQGKSNSRPNSRHHKKKKNKK